MSAIIIAMLLTYTSLYKIIIIIVLNQVLSYITPRAAADNILCRPTTIIDIEIN